MPMTSLLFFLILLTNLETNEVNQFLWFIYYQDFTGQKDTIFCGVFDGHGRHGHVVSRFIRNNLPSKLSAAVKMSQQKLSEYSDANATDSENNDQNMSLSLASWENCFVKSFNETDEDVAREINTNSFCSGSTAVTIIKQVFIMTMRIFLVLKCTMSL